ncbi:MAG: DegT/DnrJ/EryC1/StrS family aminotransferase [Patescibacteria group bacterium]|nr:DegT/DnrJ/EryC1/StrS family aminotransferase [Patescibacteria group bacterium]
MKIKLCDVSLKKEERRAVDRVLASGKLAQGKVAEDFEKKFAKFIGTKYACAASNGTAALELALLALGVGPGDEVITTPFSFIATANAILYTGARPVFVDVLEDTFNINPELIEKKITSKTKAIMPVHLYGLPANMDRIMEIAKRRGLAVVEDACQAHGAEMNGKKAGSIGAAGCFSFYPTKNMTTGEGGMITTNDAKLAEKIRLLRNHGMRVRYQHEIIGYNLRMTDIAAAIGLEQLKKLPGFNRKRTANAAFLSSRLKLIEGITVPTVSKNYKPAWHQFTVRVGSKYNLSREKLMKKLALKNIETALYYPVPIHLQPAYKNLGYVDSLPVAERLANEILSLPVQPNLTVNQLKYIIAQF